ncbi:MAG: hypothetical protein U9Q83_01870 [Bacteroidota bacterium]|nr:hypothetical protein [Bacteroidota bacterium]
MNKIIKIIISTLIFSILFSFSSQSQIIDANYGKTNNNSTPFYKPGQQLSIDGFHPPKTRKEERILNRMRRLTLSAKERSIYNRKKRKINNPNDTLIKLTSFENMRYPSILRKKERLEKLINKHNKNKTPIPSYLKKASKYRLSYEEEDILKKSETDSLTVAEEKILKKAQKKQDKIDKEKEKFTPIDVEDEEKRIYYKAKNKEQFLLIFKKRRQKLTPEERQDYPEIRKKFRHNNRIDRKIKKFKIDSAINAGAWIPVKKKKFYFKVFFAKLFKKRKPPSTYARKQNRINKRNELNEREKMALQKKQGGSFLTPKERILSNRAIAKNWRHKEQTKKLLKKEFLKTQTKATRKMIRKTKKKSDALRKKKKPNIFFKKIGNLFKKRR